MTALARSGVESVNFAHSFDVHGSDERVFEQIGISHKPKSLESYRLELFQTVMGRIMRFKIIPLQFAPTSCDSSSLTLDRRSTARGSRIHDAVGS
jgi:hypothetical protein